jgi:hypothetical protein
LCILFRLLRLAGRFDGGARTDGLLMQLARLRSAI